MKRPSPRLRAVLAALAEREQRRCVKCHKIIRGVPVQDVKGGRRAGPYHPRCAPSFRDRMEVK